MNSIKKDLTIIYMFRNGIATFFITLLSFVLHIMNYYQSSLIQAFFRSMFDNLYTVLYFLLIWVLNYLLFEIYKMVYDICKEKLSFSFIIGIFYGIPIVIMLVMLLILPRVFDINGILLGLFMMARTTKTLLKKK
jgi:hypothetical protein